MVEFVNMITKCRLSQNLGISCQLVPFQGSLVACSRLMDTKDITVWAYVYPSGQERRKDNKSEIEKKKPVCRELLQKSSVWSQGLSEFATVLISSWQSTHCYDHLHFYGQLRLNFSFILFVLLMKHQFVLTHRYTVLHDAEKSRQVLKLLTFITLAHRMWCGLLNPQVTKAPMWCASAI